MAAHETYRATGRPIMCALELAYPGLGPVPDQYLLGEDLVVAPVLEPDCTSRRVVLPPGTWADLFDPRRAFTGPGELAVPVGPDDIPVFVRAGAVLALLPDAVRSVSPYAPPVPGNRAVLAVPGEPGHAWAGPIGLDRSGRTYAAEDSWTLELSGPADGSWQLTVPLAAEPAEVDGPGSWSYTDGLLSGPLSGDSPRLRVRLAAGSGRAKHAG